MKLKKLFSVMAASAMVLSLAACGGSSDSKDSSDSASSDKQYNIGICQLVEHEALDAATQGFQDACEEKFGKDNVKFDVQNAQGEQAMCSTIINNFVSADVDLILANATLPLQTAAQATSTIPILGTSVTDYATALEIDDWQGATGINVSGTSDLAPIDEQADMLLELVPEDITVEEKASETAKTDEETDEETDVVDESGYASEAQDTSSGSEDTTYTEDTSSTDSSDYSEDTSSDSATAEETSSSSSDTSSSETSSSSQGTYLGNFKLTGYCNCAQCCGTAGNATASGTTPVAGRTVAMAGVPFGTKLLINGNVYTVEDLGTPYGHVDIYCSSHSEALSFGLQYADVYQLN